MAHQTRRLPIVVGALILVSLVVHLGTPEPGEFTTVHVGGILLTIGGSGAGLLALGLWGTPGLGVAAEKRLLAWMGGSAVVFLGIGAVTVYLGSNVVEGHELVEVFHVNGSVGLFVGFVMGDLEARGIARAEEAAREAARADALEAERERTEKRNDLLRHYVLNAVSVIDGYAGTLADRGVGADAIDVIRDRADSMALLVENVHALTAGDDPAIEPRAVPLEPLFEKAVGEDAVVICSSGAAPVAVWATDGLEQALRLLVDAVRRTADEGAAVVVTCVLRAETVQICVSGVPGALPGPIRESLFEPVTAGVGLELYLVSEFVEPFGTVEVLETSESADRVSFAIEVDRADP